MRFYHFTTESNATAILQRGFIDGHSSYMFDPDELEAATGKRELAGVFISDRPTSVQDGADGDVLLAVDVPDSVDLSHWAIVEEGLPQWEWVVPASVLNECATVTRYEFVDSGPLPWPDQTT
jgi:hypothetical protein